MAVLYITEYEDIALQAHGHVGQVPAEPALASQTVAIGGASAQSNAFNAKTKLVRLHTDAICSVSIDTNPTATTSLGRLAANQTEYRGVPKGQSFKVAVISNT